MARKAKTGDSGEKELALGYKRITDDSVKQLRWLLDFSERDLDTLGRGESWNLAWELVAFAVNASSAFSSEEAMANYSAMCNARWLEKVLKKPLPEAEPLIESEKDQPISINQRLMREFHDEMKAIFDLLFTRQEWSFTPPVRSYNIALRNLKAFPTPIAYPFTPRELLMLRAFELIRHEQDRLNLCANPRCEKRFVAAKKGRARYCSPRCSAYVRIAKSRGKDPYERKADERAGGK